MIRPLILTVAGLLAVAGCAADDGPVATIATPSNTTGFEGTYLDQPLSKPDVMLTDTDGKAFNVAQDTAGKITVLYVGYTNCPDVCPTTMAELSVAMQSLPKDVAKDVEVIFITSDPVRDQPKVIKRWLNSFTWDGITGLYGSYPKIRKAADSVGIFIDPPVKNDDGSYTVEHGAQVIVFDGNDDGRLVFTSGFSAEEVAHDLQKLQEERGSQQ